MFASGRETLPHKDSQVQDADVLGGSLSNERIPIVGSLCKHLKEDRMLDFSLILQVLLTCFALCCAGHQGNTELSPF